MKDKSRGVFYYYWETRTKNAIEDANADFRDRLPLKTTFVTRAASIKAFKPDLFPPTVVRHPDAQQQDPPPPAMVKLKRADQHENR